MLAHYDGNLKKALFALFPLIGLDKAQFEVLPCMPRSYNSSIISLIFIISSVLVQFGQPPRGFLAVRSTVSL